MNILKIAVVVILLAAAGVALVIQNQAQARLRAENASLRQQSDELARLQADNESLSNRLTRANTSADAQTTELMKLRNEVAMLRKQGLEMAALQRKNQQLNDALNSTRNALLAKPPPQTSPKVNAPESTAPDAAAGPDLGAVQLVNETPRKFDLGGGKTCTLTPTIDTDGNYHIKVLFESQKSDGQAMQAEEQTGEIITAPGRAVRITVGDGSIGFTPTVIPAP